MASPLSPDLLSPAEVCQLLHISPRTLRRYVKAGTLRESVRLPSGQRRYARADVLAVLAPAS